MAGTRTGDRGARGVLLLVVVVLGAGVVSALAHDDTSTKATGGPSTTSTTAPRATSTTRVPPGSSTTARATSTTATTGPGASTSATGRPSTTAPPTVPTPEQAANGLFAAYQAGDRAAAPRFATTDVIDVLFARAYAPDAAATFGSCVPDAARFRCHFAGASATYDMTVERDPADGSFVVTVIDLTRPVAPPSTAASP